MWWRPHPYQKRALNFMSENTHSGLFLDPGLGKTAISLMMLKRDKILEKLKGAVVIAPLRVCYNVWIQERDKWSNFHDMGVLNLHAMPKHERRYARADIMLINPESFSAYIENFAGKDLPFDTLIVDESTKYKAHNSKRFKAMRPILPKLRRRHILTGTPCPQHPQDLWSQMFILDLGERLGTNVTQFRTTYMAKSKLRGFIEYDFITQRRARFDRKVSELTVSIKAEDYLDMPDLIENEIHIDLPEKARKHYNRMEQELFTKLENGVEITTFNAAAMTSKIQQITSGFIYASKDDPDVKRTQMIHDAKMDALEEIVESTGGNPLMVVVNFYGEVDMIRKRWPKTPYIGGGLSQEKSTELINKWNKKEIPLLCIHPKSVGHGVNMQKGGDHICWMSMTWSVENYIQTVARIHRQGKEHPTTVHHFIANKTIDEVMKDRLILREKMQISVRDAIEKYWKENQ